MGYSQELSRRMGGFQNFAISFSIICILAGGIGAYTVAFGAAGGGSIGIGWLVGSFFALVVAAAMGQIASAYPTAGGLYHWGSILGGRGWGWATAWINLIGLLFVVSSVNYGVYLLARDLIFVGIFGADGASFTGTHLLIAVVLITLSQAVLNYFGIKVTTILTDFSGYLILGVTVILIGSFLFGSSVPLDFSRIVTFTNNTGDPGAGTWPATGSLFFAFVLGLLHVCYTITGFDASAHTAEETRDAQRAVPRGMLTSVFWSAVFGWVLVVAILLAMPDVTEGAKQGWSVFYWTLESTTVPAGLKSALGVGIVLSNYLCALAGMTSLSRMIYAFARDGGIPGASKFLRQVSPTHRTPGPAIWVGAILCIILGYVAGADANAYIILASGCAVFLYVSYMMPIAAGLLAEGKSWTKKGPFNLGIWSKPIAVVAIIGAAVLAFVGFQEPYQLVGQFLAAVIVLLIVVWFAFEKSRFPGPPLTEADVKARQAEIAKEEAAIGGAS
ncbi:amino acid permease [Dongia rigui]|uniref:Amino acid permease n=1 Tax=Dongia rigui TaxID=940149 RepID=A0ABU5E076_9PROT|nr:amino acid permease [Dongia rigui]MDY0872966.1 amino acid permease [Dongia rigui]